MNGMIYFSNQTNMFSDINVSATADQSMRNVTPTKNQRFPSDAQSRTRLQNNLSDVGMRD